MADVAEPMPETPFRRALRRRRERFPIWPTVGTIVVASIAFLLGIVVPLLTYDVVKHFVEARSGAAWHPLGDPRDTNSAIDLSCNLIAYVALASVLIRRLPRLARASLGELGLCALRGRALWAIALLTAANAGLWFVLPAYYRLLHAPHHVQAGFERFAIHSPREGILIAASMIVLAPFAEELLFRGLIFNALARRLGSVAGALSSGLLFGLMHQDPILLPIIALQGTLSAFAYRRTGNLWVPMCAHAINNLAAFVAQA